MGIFCRILAYDAHSPNMIMSPDPRCKFLKFLFCANFIFNVRKIHKISSGKSSLLQKLSAKHLTGDGKHPFPPPPPVPIELRTLKAEIQNYVPF